MSRCASGPVPEELLALAFGVMRAGVVGHRHSGDAVAQQDPKERNHRADEASKRHRPLTRLCLHHFPLPCLNAAGNLVGTGSLAHGIHCRTRSAVIIAAQNVPMQKASMMTIDKPIGGPGAMADGSPR